MSNTPDVEAMPDGYIDVCLFHGSLRSEENSHMAQLLRRKSKVLVAYGACAMHGGVIGLANLTSVESLIHRAFTTESTDNPEGLLPRPDELVEGFAPGIPKLLPRVRALHQEVPVDYFVPGCPPESHQTWSVCRAIASRNLPPVGSIVGGR
jgi:F420-non-reducing hydrogenase small subunit